MNIKIYMGLLVIVHVMLVDFAVNHVKVMDVLEDWSDISLLLHLMLCGGKQALKLILTEDLKFLFPNNVSKSQSEPEIE